MGHEEAAESLGTTEGPSQPSEDVQASRGATEGSPGGQWRGRAQEMGRQGREPLPSPPLSAAHPSLRLLMATPALRACSGGALGPMSPAPGWGRPACAQRPARVRRPLSRHPRALPTAPPIQIRSRAQRLGLARGLLSQLGEFMKNREHEERGGGKIPPCDLRSWREADRAPREGLGGPAPGWTPRLPSQHTPPASRGGRREGSVCP